MASGEWPAFNAEVNAELVVDRSRRNTGGAPLLPTSDGDEADDDFSGSGEVDDME